MLNKLIVSMGYAGHFSRILRYPPYTTEMPSVTAKYRGKYDVKIYQE